MRLISNWKTVALKSFSMWAAFLTLLWLLTPEVIFALTGRDMNPVLVWGVALVIALANPILRLLDQGGLDRTTLKSPWFVGVLVILLLAGCDDRQSQTTSEAQSTTATEVVASDGGADPFIPKAIAHIGKWEDLELQAYLDKIARPPVWTICYGETRGVQAGDTSTKAECDAMFAVRVKDFQTRLHVHFTAETLAARLPVARDIAYTSLAYNAGVGAISKSTAVRRLNAGDIVGGCEAIGWWKKAGGRVIRGLVRRRSEEVEMCLKGAA